MLVTGLASSREMEGSGSAKEDAAGRGEHSRVACGTLFMEGHRRSSARRDEYLCEPARESGPQGRHSGEAVGVFDPREVRVAAAHDRGGYGSTI